MTSNNFLFDTNIFVYFLLADQKVEEYFSEEFISGNNIYYSIITEIEILSFPKLTNEEIKNIKELLKKFSPVSLTGQIVEKTIEIKKKVNLQIADSIIAASAAVLKATLITRDEAFLKVKGIDLINPFKNPV